MLKGFYHLPQFMPRCKDARRLDADPKNEPDFYSISVLFPLKDPSPLPQVEQSYSSYNNNMTASVQPIPTTTVTPPSLAAMWNQRFQAGLLAGHANKINHKSAVPDGNQLAASTPAAATSTTSTASCAPTPPNAALASFATTLAQQPRSSVMSSSSPLEHTTSLDSSTIPPGLQALLGNTGATSQPQHQQQLFSLSSIASALQTPPAAPIGTTFLPTTTLGLSSLLTALGPTTNNTGNHATTTNLLQLLLAQQQQQLQQQQQQHQDTNLLQVLSLLMSQQQQSSQTPQKQTELVQPNDDKLMALLVQHLAQQQQQQQPSSGTFAFF
eukprot:scaffold14501_cov163-Amphora_coffeaeformis.AAC.2